MTVVKELSIMLDNFCTSFLSNYYALLTKVLQTCRIQCIIMYSQSLSGATCTLFSKTVIWAVVITLCMNLNKMLTTILEGEQWLSGRVLDLRQKGHVFEPQRRHCVVSLGLTRIQTVTHSDSIPDRIF